VTEAEVWGEHVLGYSHCAIGDYRVIVWQGNMSEDLSHQVCSVYLPVGARGCPDGRVLVGRRVLDTRNRAAAQVEAEELARAAIALDAGRRAGEVGAG